MQVPDQTSHSVASGLVLRCLPMSHKKDAMLINGFKERFL